MKVWTFEIRGVGDEEQENELWWPRRVWPTKEAAREAANRYDKAEWQSYQELEGTLDGLEEYKPLAWSPVPQDEDNEEFAESEHNSDSFELVTVEVEDGPNT